MPDVKLPETPSTTNPPSSPRQVLLGLFILFQLAFLFGSNLIGYVMWAPSQSSDNTKQVINQLVPTFADNQGHVWKWGDQLDANWRRWAQLTGQDQSWSLFAPSVATATGFPAILLLWDEPTPAGPSFADGQFTFDQQNGFNLVLAPNAPPARRRLVLSENEPENIESFVRIGKFRLRRYEGQVYLNPQPYDDEGPNDLAARLTRRMHSLLTDYHDTAHEYLRWRMKNWKRDHPDEPTPRQVVLLHRLYRIHGPDEPSGWDGPFIIPMARWRPEAARNDVLYALEPFDFTEKRFVPMSR